MVIGAGNLAAFLRRVGAEVADHQVSDPVEVAVYQQIDIWVILDLSAVEIQLLAQTVHRQNGFPQSFLLLGTGVPVEVGGCGAGTQFPNKLVGKDKRQAQGIPDLHPVDYTAVHKVDGTGFHSQLPPVFQQRHGTGGNEIQLHIGVPVSRDLGGLVRPVDQLHRADPLIQIFIHAQQTHSLSPFLPCFYRISRYHRFRSLRARSLHRN